MSSSSTPGPSDGLKRTMSDAESSPLHSKKPRRDSSPEPCNKRGDTKRRKKRKKKAPLVNPVDPNRQDDRSCAPLFTRNEIIRFTSAPSEPDPATRHPSQAPSSKPPSKTHKDSVVDRTRDMPSTSHDKLGTAGPSLEEKVAQLEAEIKSKNNLIATHQTLLNQVQQAVTCQVCLDLMYRPYALAPCGHLACHSCLVNWFTAPPPDNHAAPPSIKRKKTCPHCRAVVRERPVEVWGVKNIAQATGKSGLLQNQLPLPLPENLNANDDPWKDIFPKSGASHRRFPWFFPHADIDIDDDGDAHIAHIAPRGEDVGMLDMEDGGIYRCLDCMHEIWDGVCTSCGRDYPGHRPQADDDDDDDDEGDPMGWLEDQMGAEEVDVADDPGWMGLEDGEADDSGDPDDWRPFEPWRRRFHTFRGPWGFLGAIHIDGEDEEDETYSGADDSRVADEDEGSEDEGYESSFIDDGDRVHDLGDGPRIYEIDDDDDDSNQRCHTVGVSSDEEAPWYAGRRARYVESDDSDA